MRTTAVFAALAATSLAQISVPGLPSCADSCITGFGNCQQLDVKCICSDTSLISQLACCVSAKCNAADQAATIQFADSFCQGQAGVTNLPQSATCAPGQSPTPAGGSASSATSTGSSAASSAASSATGSAASAASSAESSISSAASSAASAASSAASSVSSAMASAASSVSSALASAASSASSAAASATGAAGSVKVAGGMLGAVVAGVVAVL